MSTEDQSDQTKESKALLEGLSYGKIFIWMGILIIIFWIIIARSIPDEDENPKQTSKVSHQQNKIRRQNPQTNRKIYRTDPYEVKSIYKVRSHTQNWKNGTKVTIPYKMRGKKMGFRSNNQCVVMVRDSEIRSHKHKIPDEICPDEENYLLQTWYKDKIKLTEIFWFKLSPGSTQTTISVFYYTD